MKEIKRYKSNKNSLISKEDLFDIIFNNIYVGIDIIDNRGNMIYYNKAMEELEGLSAEEVLGNFVFDVFPSFNYENSTMFKCIETGKPIYDNIQSYLNNKGEQIYAMVTNIPIVKDGEVEGVVEFALDMDTIGNLYKTFNRWYSLKDTVFKKEKEKKGVDFYNLQDFKTKNIELKRTIERLEDVSKYDYNVLLFGETGTGKEILAQSIHNASYRKNKPFIAQNCAAIPENLLESIFFGTVKGSFTGAENKPGLFELADGGTIFLDELNSLPIHPQAKLLRAIEEGYVRRVGGQEDIKVDVRVIASVNKEPLNLVYEKKLREDLFYRISQIYIEIPPLRTRKEDILYLSGHFIKENSEFLDMKPIKLSSKVEDIFMNYPWMGNVRELKNVVIQSMINLKLEDGNEIEVRHIPKHIINENKKRKMKKILKYNEDKNYEERIIEVEKKLISEALYMTDGNVSEAARLLKIKRQTLQYKIKKYEIENVE
ncbi:sigma 54-interacting transcriptional regulator [Anaerosalibacter massiliensis]|uniref:Sigma 54-interacting transcriptional regulator n=1 Tax=Anaerosalibacter massiliensis TaxID=1347392 RepID=A0A9X2S732_9FIRM|nr:sigma 54-interacting transcriptional regulator [Anaerosalibacter massiliensis]MCR2044327.1 sigma 54-interacting transcriptional regulator [Anaerosalibacter massiliensis]